MEESKGAVWEAEQLDLDCPEVWSAVRFPSLLNLP